MTAARNQSMGLPKKAGEAGEPGEGPALALVARPWRGSPHLDDGVWGLPWGAITSQRRVTSLKRNYRTQKGPCPASGRCPKEGAERPEWGSGPTLTLSVPKILLFSMPIDISGKPLQDAGFPASSPPEATGLWPARVPLPPGGDRAAREGEMVE